MLSGRGKNGRKSERESIGPPWHRETDDADGPIVVPAAVAATAVRLSDTAEAIDCGDNFTFRRRRREGRTKTRERREEGKYKMSDGWTRAFDRRCGAGPPTIGRDTAWMGEEGKVTSCSHALIFYGRRI